VSRQFRASLGTQLLILIQNFTDGGLAGSGTDTITSITWLKRPWFLFANVCLDFLFPFFFRLLSATRWSTKTMKDPGFKIWMAKQT